MQRQLIFTARYTAIRCASCGDPILLGPAVCPACKEAGHCTICGLPHRPTQCPEVIRVRRDMEAAERAMQAQIVTDALCAIRATALARVDGVPF